MVAEKRAAEPEQFASAVRAMANQQIRSDALRDVGNLALASFGAGVGGRGALGLIHLLRQGRRKKTRSGPAELPLPYPIEPSPARTFVTKGASFLAGDAATTKAGIPWYGPAMLLGGMGALGVGWKGMDAVLDHRREAEREKALAGARQEFHDALLAQYDRPLDSLPHPKVVKEGGDATMAEVGRELDAFYGEFEKAAIDLGNLGGAALGGYGMYAGLSGLLTGALVYDKASKRNRAAIVAKALQRRQRRRFMQNPSEIYARPEPVESLPSPPEGEGEEGLFAEKEAAILPGVTGAASGAGRVAAHAWKYGRMPFRFGGAAARPGR